jgi:hypothetical protein
LLEGYTGHDGAEQEGQGGGNVFRWSEAKIRSLPDMTNLYLNRNENGLLNDREGGRDERIEGHYGTYSNALHG